MTIATFLNTVAYIAFFLFFGINGFIHRPWMVIVYCIAALILALIAIIQALK